MLAGLAESENFVNAGMQEKKSLHWRLFHFAWPDLAEAGSGLGWSAMVCRLGKQGRMNKRVKVPQSSSLGFS